jgi:ribosome-associated translation inhibitor RaiA
MQVPLEITFRGMDPSPAVEATVRRCANRLGHLYDRVQLCRVWIDLPHRHRRRGAQFQVRISLAVPGDELAVAHDHGDADVYVALADAFLAIRRQLQDHARIRRGDVKAARLVAKPASISPRL